MAAPATVDIAALRDRKNGILDELRGQIAGSAKRLKVEVVYGTGRMTGPRTIEVALADGGTATLEGDALILATGSEVFKLPCIDHDLSRVWTSDDAVEITEIPAQLTVVGGGIIGLEFACAYAAFGTKVTVIELQEQVMPGNDKRVARAVQQSLEAMGVTFLLGAMITGTEQVGDRVRAILADGTVLESDILMSAVGRKPRSEGFGFPEAGIKFLKQLKKHNDMDRAAVATDKYLRTNVAGVYAVGDVIGGMMLAHVAEEEGVVAARNAVAELRAASGEGPAAADLHCIDYDVIPACVYTFPEVGVVGSTRDGAKERGKALAEGEAEGFVQLVVEKGTGRFLGAQIVGPHAVEIINEVVGAMTYGVDARSIAEMCHAHPTVSEVIKTAAGDAATKAGV